LVIDPWWAPDQFLDGFIARDLIRDDGRAIARLSRSTRTGRSVTNEAHYIVADSQGIAHFGHAQQLTLFTRAEYLAAIENSGCISRHIENEQFTPRGLLIGIRQ
jgi:dTDP-3-amino-3,4,6-trideoxy-alpha-D-glucopyranose N,N-dimethyltransferase/N-dimethyltransferase